MEFNTSNTGIAVPQAGNTVLATLDVRKVNSIMVHINVADQDLDAFIIEGQGHESGGVSGDGYETLYSAAGDFTSPAGLLTATSGDLTTQAASSSGWFIMDVGVLNRVRISASSGNVAGSSVDIFAIGRTAKQTGVSP